jgi:hypothetical protein
MNNIMTKGIAGLGLLGVLAQAGCATDVGTDDVELKTGAFTAEQCAETTGGSSAYLPYGSYVVESSLPTTKAACQAVTIRSVFYRTYMGGWVIQKDESHTGVWGPIPIGRTGCSLEGTSFPVPGVPGVRVATTIRRPSGSSFVTYPFTTSFQRKPR